MSSASMAAILPSPGPSSSSMATQRSIAQRPIASSSSISSNVKPAPPKASSSRLAPAPALAPAPTKQSQPIVAAAATPPKLKAAPLVSPSPSISPPVPKKDNSSGPLVQPTKEWVLPARAKPGRKPSETEPLTKRKAQNRASQRAFRERKQSYLSDLEAKVAAYEAAEIDRSVEIQKVAQKLRAENEALRKEVGVWKDKFGQLERLIVQAKANGGRLPGVVPSTRSGPGCKAPAHERVPKRGVLVNPGSKTGKDRERSAGGVRFADAVEQDKLAAEPAASVPLRRRPSSSSTPILPVGSASPASTTCLDTNASPLEAVSAQATTFAPRKGVKPPLWSFEAPKPPSPTTPSAPAAAASPSNKDSSLLSPSLLPHGGHLSVEGGCGFCTEASPCVCADDFLDLSTQSQPSHIAVPSEVPSAVPLPTRTPGATPAASTSSSSTAAETSRRMSIGSLTHANDVALNERRRTITTNTKLWYTVSQPESPPASVPLTIKKTPKAGAGKKLWSVTPAAAQNSSPEPICTGDPSTCGACSTDPGLAAFCEAITTATTGATPSSSSTLLPPSAAAPSPIRPVGMARAGTTSLLPSSSTYTSSGETIPSAWRQIRSHPRFSQWQGGLDLLAEVVSKRSGNVHSPLLSSATVPSTSSKRPREASVEIDTPRTTTISSSAMSTDRATLSNAKPALLHSASDSSLVRIKMEDTAEQEGEKDRETKRRRILIDREAVKEALALLDAGTAAHPRGSAQKEEQVGPCPCPWRPGEKRSSP